MSAAVQQVFNRLFDSLVSEATSSSTPPSASSIGKIASVYPQIWCKTTKSRLDALKPSTSPLQWIALLGHISACVPFPCVPLSDLEPLIEYSVTSIFSVDERIRVVGFSSLRSISTLSPDAVLAKLAFSLKIYAPNAQVLSLLESLIVVSRENAKRIHQLLLMLLSEEEAVHADLIGSVAECVASAALSATAQAEKQLLADLLEALLPMCWRQDLMNSRSIFGIFKAVAALLTVLPDRTALRSVQSGVMRLLVSTKSEENLKSVIETVKILVSCELFCETDETVSACVPILIDIGIAIGPLAVLQADGPVPAALALLWRSMTDAGVQFLTIRLMGELSVTDKLVSMVYFTAALAGRRAAGNCAELSAQCIDQLCSQMNPVKAEPYLVSAVLELVKTTGRVSESTVQFLIAAVTNETSDNVPSSIRQYWFSPSSGSGDSGPSKLAVRAQACSVLTILAESAKDGAALILTQVTEAMKKFPSSGVDCLVSCLVKVRRGAAPLPPEVVVWSHLNCEDRAVLTELTGSSLDVYLERIGDDKFSEQVVECLLSKPVVERLSGGGVMSALAVARSLIRVAPEGAMRRAVLQCLQRSDQDLIRVGSAIVEPFAILLGELGKHRFSDFTAIVSEMTIFLSKTKHRLIVIFGLKKNSSELVSCIVRASLGYAAPYCPPAEVTDRLVSPCLETLKELMSVKSVIAPTSELVAATLGAVERVFQAATAAAVVSSAMNELVTTMLPLVVFNADEADGESPPRVAVMALRAITAIASAESFTPTTFNFDHAMQFSVSLLVHRVTSFSTVASDEHDERIAVVSALLVSMLRHSFNRWLGVSRLAQLLLPAGSNSPLPILRLICSRVFLEVVKCVLQDCPRPTDSMEFIESLAIMIPRTFDPVTKDVSKDAARIVMEAAGAVWPAHAELGTILVHSHVLPSSTLTGFAQLMLHASTDGDHGAAVATLDLLNSILLARGEDISSADSAGIVSKMLTYADRQPAVQPQILECLFSLSLAHLSTSLNEIVSESLINERLLSDAQVGAIRALAREKKLLVGFLNFMSDLMNNAEPKSGETIAGESVVAAKAMQIALTVNDSLIPVIVGKLAAPLFGTCLLFQQQAAIENNLVDVVLRLLGAPEEGRTVETAVRAFLERVDQQQVTGLVEFLIPFLSRDVGGIRSLAVQKATAETALCALLSRSDKLPNATRIKEAFAKAHSVKGLRQVLIQMPSIFSLNDLKLVIRLLETDALMSDSLAVVLVAAEMSAKPKGDQEWRIELLDSVDQLTEIVTTRINCEQVEDNLELFKLCLNIAGLMCDVAGFCSEPIVVEAFRNTVATKLLLELEIRAEVLMDLHDDDPQFVARTIEKLRKVRGNAAFAFSDFKRTLAKYLNPKSDDLLYSRSSPSRSPLVVHGAAKMTVAIINNTNSPTDRSVMMRSLIRIINARRKNFLLDSAKEHVIDAIGELVVSF